MAKTENAAEVGLHVFERAGLGKYPFRWLGARETVWQAYPGAPKQAGTTCDYCGQGIMTACDLQSADGKRFKVGCDCVMRSGDAGLLKAYKASPSLRKLNRAKAAAKAARVEAEWNALMADAGNRAKLDAVKLPPPWQGGPERTLLSSLEWTWSRCGAAGRARYLKTLKAKLAA